MKRQFIAVGASLLLVACGQGDVDLKNATVADVVKATVVSKTINPGEWSVTNEVTAVDMPGMPAEAKQMMSAMSKAMVGKKDIAESCVTKEIAEKPPAEMFAGKDGGACKFEKFAIDNGELNAVMTCANPKGGPGGMTMKMAGQYGGNSYDINSEMTMSGMGNSPAGAAMIVKSHASGKRTGECKA